MANINWDQPFFFQGFPIPTYGNYGGPQFTAGVREGFPTDEYDPIPEDALDTLFAAHDVVSADPNASQFTADLALVQGIVALKPNQLDEEASVYAGATTLAFLALLSADASFDFVPEKQIAKATKDAVHNIERGIKKWSESEIEDAQDWLTAIAPVDIGSVLDTLGVDLPKFHGHHADWLLEA